MAGIIPHHIFVLELRCSQENSFHPQPRHNSSLLPFLRSSMAFWLPFPFHVSTLLGPKVTSPVVLGCYDYRLSESPVQCPLDRFGGRLQTRYRELNSLLTADGFPSFRIFSFTNRLRLWLCSIRRSSAFVEGLC